MHSSTKRLIAHIVFDCFTCGACVTTLVAWLYFAFGDTIVVKVLQRQCKCFADYIDDKLEYTKTFTSQKTTEGMVNQLRSMKQSIRDSSENALMEETRIKNNTAIKKRTQTIFFSVSLGLLFFGIIWYLLAINMNFLKMSVAVLKNILMTFIMAGVECAFLYFAAVRILPLNPIIIDEFFLPYMKYYYCNNTFISQQPPFNTSFNTSFNTNYQNNNAPPFNTDQQYNNAPPFNTDQQYNNAPFYNTNQQSNNASSSNTNQQSNNASSSNTNQQSNNASSSNTNQQSNNASSSNTNQQSNKSPLSLHYPFN